MDAREVARRWLPRFALLWLFFAAVLIWSHGWNDFNYTGWWKTATLALLVVAVWTFMARFTRPLRSADTSSIDLAALRAECLAMKATGREGQIRAINLYRSKTGCSLAQAKDAIDHLSA